MNKVKADSSQPDLVKLESVQLGAVQLDSFIDHLWLEDGLSKNTLESYRADLSHFNLWLSKQKSELLKAAILDATQADIQAYLEIGRAHV